MSRRFFAGMVIAFVVIFSFGFLFIERNRTNSTRSSPTSSTNKLKVVATIFPIADMIRHIGGDHVEVVTILPPGASPHSFEPTPASVREIAGATALFKIGQGLDDWSEKITNASDAIIVVDFSSKIALRTLEGNPDPHYWLSPTNGLIIADTVSQTLATLDPTNAQTYQNNLIAYRANILSTDARIKTLFAPVKTRDFATFHEAWFYFADRYGLTVSASFEPSPNKEPTPQYLAKFMETIKQKQIRIIFSEPQLSPDVIMQTAKDLGVKLDTLDPIGGTSPETDSYVKMLEWNADKIAQALK